MSKHPQRPRLGCESFSPNFRKPNVCVTKAEVEWITEAARILEGGDVSKLVRRKAASYLRKLARDAERSFDA